MRECRIGKFETDLLTGHKPSADDVTARAYLDLEKLDWLYPEVQKIGNWIEEQAAVAALGPVIVTCANADGESLSISTSLIRQMMADGMWSRAHYGSSQAVDAGRFD